MVASLRVASAMKAFERTCEFKSMLRGDACSCQQRRSPSRWGRNHRPPGRSPRQPFDRQARGRVTRLSALRVDKLDEIDVFARTVFGDLQQTTTPAKPDRRARSRCDVAQLDLPDGGHP